MFDVSAPQAASIFPRFHRAAYVDSRHVSTSFLIITIIYYPDGTGERDSELFWTEVFRGREILVLEADLRAPRNTLQLRLLTNPPSAGLI